MKRGFTLIEVLIVVVILAALAAIAVPQFNTASNDARRGTVQSTVQTLRSQIALYRLQHGERLPNLLAGWDPLTRRTDRAGQPDPPPGTHAYGPYVLDGPANALNGSSVVTDGDGSGRRRPPAGSSTTTPAGPGPAASGHGRGRAGADPLSPAPVGRSPLRGYTRPDGRMTDRPEPNLLARTQATYNRSTRDHWDHFAAHRRRVTDLLTPPGELVVVGSGGTAGAPAAACACSGPATATTSNCRTCSARSVT
jgi:general secretion pathway protein G